MKKYFISIFTIILLFAFYDCSKNKNESCSDGIMNQDETQVDCGGVCSVCSSCSDGKQNQNETGIDCGGICAHCPSCFDGVQNQGETGVDCGGPCTLSCSPATQNTSLTIGGPGWSNPTCGSTNSLTLKGINGVTEVSFTFNSAIQTGTYVVAASPGANACSVNILNAPNQPAGIVWVAKSGLIVITVTANSISGVFNGIVCRQANYYSPTVVLSGTVGCNP